MGISFCLLCYLIRFYLKYLRKKDKVKDFMKVGGKKKVLKGRSKLVEKM